MINPDAKSFVKLSIGDFSFKLSKVFFLKSIFLLQTAMGNYRDKNKNSERFLLATSFQCCRLFIIPSRRGA